MLARVTAALATAVLGCARPQYKLTAAPPSTAQQPSSRITCPASPTSSAVRVDVVGNVADATVATEVARTLCPRLEELAHCMSIAHGSAPEVRGTIDVVLDLASARSRRPVAVVGGTVADRFRACVVNSLEVTGGTFAEALQLTLNVVVPPAGPKTAGDDSNGRLPPEEIRKLIKAHFPYFRDCYERRREVVPGLAGTVAVKFIVDEYGGVSSVDVEPTSSIEDAEMRACVREGYLKISFPRPVGGKVMVTYPIEFSMD